MIYRKHRIRLLDDTDTKLGIIRGPKVAYTVSIYKKGRNQSYKLLKSILDTILERENSE